MTRLISEKAMEGKVYNCSWSRAKGKYLVFLANDPAVSALDKEFLVASDALSERICQLYGDGEAVLQFDPPPPRDAGLNQWTTPEVVAIGYNDRVNSNMCDPGMYTETPCSKCGYARGHRTQTPLRIDQSPNSMVAKAVGSRPTVLLYSKAFLDLFDPAAVARIEFRQVAASVALKTPYFELIGGQRIPQVGFQDAQYKPLTNWICSMCGRRSLQPYHPSLFGTAIQLFASRESISNSVPGLFLVQADPETPVLCMRLEKWSALKGNPAVRGVVTQRLGMVPASLAQLKPEILSDYPA